MENDNSRFLYTKSNLPVVSNGNLQCNDCEFRYEDTDTECRKYFLKPDYVLKAEKDCPKFKKGT